MMLKLLRKFSVLLALINAIFYIFYIICLWSGKADKTVTTEHESVLFITLIALMFLMFPFGTLLLGRNTRSYFEDFNIMKGGDNKGLDFLSLILTFVWLKLAFEIYKNEIVFSFIL
jgi:hypothetical protein